MADIALSSAVKLVKVCLDIKDAVETDRQNKKLFGGIARSMGVINYIVRNLSATAGCMNHMVVIDAVDDVANSLTDALNLIEDCKKRRNFVRVWMARDTATKLRQMNTDINQKLQLAFLATYSGILQKSTLTNSIQQPLQISMLIISVDLECCRCIRKMKVVLCHFQDGEDGRMMKVNFDNRSNQITIAGCFDPQWLTSKLFCKARNVIKDIRVVEEPAVERTDVEPPPSTQPQEMTCQSSAQAQAQYLDEQRLTSQPFVPQIRFVFGKPLVMSEELKALPTEMRRFHEWYMSMASKGVTAFPAHVKGDYYCHDDHKIWLDFKDIFDVYQQDAMDITLISVWTLMVMQTCRRDKITNLGFIDPEVVNQDAINRDFDLIFIALKAMVRQQHSKSFFLLPYRFKFHWILIILSVKDGVITIMDSLRKPTTEYPEIINMLQKLWEEHILTAHPSSSQLQRRLAVEPNFPCYKQPQGTNHCGYYVCEAMRIFVGERTIEQNLMSISRRHQVLPSDRLNAIQEQMMGFILEQIAREGGEFYCPLEEY